MRTIHVLVPIADGTEEMEAVILIDTFRRAEWNVTAVALQPGPITASRGVRLIPDAIWDDVDPETADLIVIPGGLDGVEHLRQDPRIRQALSQHAARGKTVAAVCAGPLVLQDAGILEGKRVTCHPGVADQLTATSREDEIVVIDQNLITSQGPGTTLEFALTLIAHMDGPKKAHNLAQAMCHQAL